VNFLPNLGLEATGKVLGRLISTSVRPSAVLVEIVFLPLIAVFLGLWLNPQDPLWSEASFPWAWFAPVLLALRYGPLVGLAGSGILLAAWLILNVGHYDAFPKLFFLGGLILMMLVGEFSSLWLARARRAETLQLYLDQRLENLTRQYYLLRLSHDRLEQDLIGRPMSMRDALARLRPLRSGSTTPKEGAATLLGLLAQYCRLESASLHAIGASVADAELLASIGHPEALRPSDPLILQAVESRRLCHVRQTLNEGGASTRYLIAAPLIDLEGNLYGLLTVEEMPFVSLQEETLQTINLLLGYYTDGLAMGTLAASLLEQFPLCPPEFAFEAERLWRLRQTTGLPSVIVALEMLPRAVAQDLPGQFQRMKRGLDENWLIAGAEKQVLATLMPLGNHSTAEGYISRLESWAKQKNERTLAELGVFPHTLPLDADAPAVTLQHLLRLAND
jgi:hypothetical protein